MYSRPPGLAKSLASDIEQMIDTRGLRPGERIATMEELREQTGYGRATIGETVRLLTERGSAEVRPGRGGGLFVAQVSPVVRLRQTLLRVPQGATTVADAIAVRDSLEELIALEAARGRTDRDAEDLEACLDALREAGNHLERFLQANWALHERIAEITSNHLARAMYVGTMRCIAELTVRADREADSTPNDYLARRLAVHEELVAAITLGDEDRTRAAVEAHRGGAASGLLDGCSGPGPAGADQARAAARADVGDDAGSAVAVDDEEPISVLRRENEELRRANAILKSASAFFAAELNRTER
ncbi:FadR/GntR family transcriptional regulator [Streptomyces sp. NPDC058534]|uniref:FadR/GntR family transcriptional regulator n=1 Tax=Streptomyces sp. NPDC058534 TaxID=3346541 RepID=UPI00365500C2